jgi:hypothetical protein
LINFGLFSKVIEPTAFFTCIGHEVIPCYVC